MTAPVIDNHGDVISYIHETLAKKDPISDRKALVRLLAVFGEKEAEI
tara:strand:- start:337 stop:477 length:141 start_codon:yes stop_codon:yes gene_type:complete